MAEKKITVHKTVVFVPMSTELAEEAEHFGDAVRQALADPSTLPKLLPNDTPVDKPALYTQLLAVADPLGRAIAELHEPRPYVIREDRTVPWRVCRGCDFEGMDAEPPEWPCRTVDALAEHYGIGQG